MPSPLGPPPAARLNGIWQVSYSPSRPARYRRYSTNADAFLLAVQELAGASTGLSVVDQAKQAVNIVKARPACKLLRAWPLLREPSSSQLPSLPASARLPDPRKHPPSPAAAPPLQVLQALDQIRELLKVGSCAAAGVPPPKAGVCDSKRAPAQEAAGSAGAPAVGGPRGCRDKTQTGRALLRPRLCQHASAWDLQAGEVPPSRGSCRGTRQRLRPFLPTWAST